MKWSHHFAFSFFFHKEICTGVRILYKSSEKWLPDTPQRKCSVTISHQFSRWWDVYIRWGRGKRSLRREDQSLDPKEDALKVSFSRDPLPTFWSLAECVGRRCSEPDSCSPLALARPCSLPAGRQQPSLSKELILPSCCVKGMREVGFVPYFPCKSL